ncbi:hypothetical protein CP97_14671 [Aurantiacibacter atlanticus]|uniref:Uncharacterized protein n=1 Tax=Aurantiacibacter atlanticus TaxID=1648404 RepID=A0A168M0K8_9SPHN|nr:hypothetical protein CP97_14671 [Aurantiacibacter atlanticus]
MAILHATMRKGVRNLHVFFGHPPFDEVAAQRKGFTIMKPE